MRRTPGGRRLVRHELRLRGDKHDGTGQTHRGLEEFLDDNDLLSHDDVIMAPEDITGVPGEGRLVTLYGHPAPAWQWWVLGATSVVVLLSGGAFLRQQTRP